MRIKKAITLALVIVLLALMAACENSSDTPYEKNKTAALITVNPETMTVEKTLKVSENFEATDASLKGESIVIRLSDRTIIVDKSLSRYEDIKLPDVIAEKINRETKYNEKGCPDVFFGGYDVSTDGTKYAYADEVGVKLYDAADGSEKLLSKTVPITGSELIDNSFHRDPRFVAGEQKVITTMTGYESAMGYTLCDLESETVKTYGIGSECSSTGLIRYDTGLMEINNFVRAPNDQDGDYKTIYLDFDTGIVQEIALEDPGDTGYILPSDYSYIGRNFAAFITFRQDSSDNANNMFYVNRLDLKTLQIEPEIISVKAAGTHILGVLADGRVVFWYDLNPSENGVCITKS